MKKFLKIISIAATMITLMACSKTQIYVIERGGFTPYSGMYYVPQNANGEYGIVFGNYNPGTKAESVNGVYVGPDACGYDSFDVYTYKDGTDAVMNPYTVTWDSVNSVWTYETAPQELQYFDRNSTYYDFVGVISDKASVYNAGNVEISDVEAFLDNTDEMNTPGELLWAGAHVLKETGYATPVQLSFAHANAKMYVGFASDRNDTVINDYTPYNPGTPDQAAWDEVVDVTTYQMTATTVPTLGPLVTAISISDDDIAFVNSKYTASKGFESYQSNNTITGNLDENMWEYLLSEYPALSSINTGNWNSYSSNANMRLVHIDKSGHTSADNDSYRGVWVNVQSVNWGAGTTTQTVIHHDAVPGTPATGCEGIRVFSVDVDPADSKYVVADHTTKADASISTTACILTQSEADDEVLTFAHPTGAVAQFATYNDVVVGSSTFSPTTFYALPVANPAEGYVVKFSYTYNGVNYYDARVHLPAADTDFAQGFYYKYVIHIGATTNGTTDPNDAEADKDEVDTSKNPITFNVTVSTGYGAGVEKTYQLQ